MKNVRGSTIVGMNEKTNISLVSHKVTPLKSTRKNRKIYLKAII